MDKTSRRNHNGFDYIIIIIILFAKNVDPTDVDIITKEDQLVIKTIKTEKINFNLEFHLSHAVFPDKTQIKYFPSKVYRFYL